MMDLDSTEWFSIMTKPVKMCIVIENKKFNFSLASQALKSHFEGIK